MSVIMTYSQRLVSFNTWPQQMIPTDEELALAGFTYLGSGDKVRCESCGLRLYNWTRKDNALLEHMKFSSNCKFIEN